MSLTESPYIFDGHLSADDELIELPVNVTAEYLADVIRNHHIAIGGIVSESVVLFHPGYPDEDYDFSHCVSHEINRKELEEYYYRPTTVGQLLKEKYAQLHRLSHESKELIYVIDQISRFESDELKQARANKDPRIRELEEKETQRTDPLPLYSSAAGRVVMYEGELRTAMKQKEMLDNATEEEKADSKNIQLQKILLNERLHKKTPDMEIERLKKLIEEMRTLGPKMFYIEKVQYGFEYIHGVPLDVQIEACAIVAGVTIEEMKVKLMKASGK